MHRRAIGFAAIIAACWAMSVNAAVSATPQPLVLAVHPYLPAAEIATRFSALADYLARASGRPVQARVGRNYAEHIDAIGTDSVDIAYMGPVPYVKLVSRYGKKPLLARQQVNSQRYLRGVMIVRQDSPIRTLADLKGKRFAFGDPDSTMSHVLPLYLLQKAGVPQRALAHHEFLGAHKNVALAVLAGDYDAGAVKQEVFQEFSSQGLRALAELPPVSDHLFVASAKLPASLVAVLRHALLRLKDTPEGKKIMSSIHPHMTALAPALDSDYDNLRVILDNKASRLP